MSKRFNKIYIEITNKCNLTCSFCSKDILPKREMTPSEFEKIIYKVKNYTDIVYLHVKGEPLLHSNLDEILTICDNNNIKVNITTNGTLLMNKKNILLNHYIRKINISLHCENNYTNYYENVFEVCDELSRKSIIIYRIWTLPSLDLDRISTNIVEKLNNHYHLSTDIVHKIKKEKNIKINNNIFVDKDYEFDWPIINQNKRNIGTCLGTRSHIAILSNGDVVPCCLDSNGVNRLGNIFDNDLDFILNSELFRKINSGFQNNKIVSDLCQSCTYCKRFDV